jgi:hypothetical protein
MKRTVPARRVGLPVSFVRLTRPSSWLARESGRHEADALAKPLGSA